MKKLLALVLSLLMILTSGIAVFADDATTADEVTLDATAEEVEKEAGPYDLALAVLNKLAILQGDENGDLMADADVQRYQAATIIARVMTGDVSSNWAGYAANYTTFEDLVDGYEDYNAPIGYCFQKGVINGKSETVFDPAGQITFQELLKMCVCALGYVTEGIAVPFSAVDATLPYWLEDEIYDDANSSRYLTRYYTTYEYPYETTEKGIALGLTKGITGVALEDPLTRGEVAQIVYNMLVAINDTGTTYINDVFEVEEAVMLITGAKLNRYYAEDTTAVKTDYVNFRLLGTNGAPVGSTYTVPYADFALEGFVDASETVGKTYTLATSDKYHSFLYCFKNPTATYWNLGQNNLADEIQKTTVDSVVYTLVEKYTDNRTAQGTNSGLPEVIAYKPYGTTTTNNLVFNYDANGNIVNAAGEIQLVYLTFAGKYFVPQYKLDANKDKITATATDPSCNGKVITGYTEATDADLQAASQKAAATTANFVKVTDVNDYAYASLEYIDDNTDGVYDRAEYNEYALVYIYTSDKDDDGHTHTIAKTLANNTSAPTDVYFDYDNADQAITWVNVSDKDLTVDLDGTFAIVFMDKQTRICNVLDILEVKYGTLNHYNVDTKTVWIDNVEIPANYDTMLGAGFRSYDADKGYKQAIGEYFYSLYRTAVKYIVLDGELVYLADATTSKGIIVINKVIGLTMSGTIEVQAYVSGKIGIQTIQIAAINNYYLGFGFGSYLTSLVKGTVLTFNYTDTLDADGLYYVGTNPRVWNTDAENSETLAFTPNCQLGYFDYGLCNDGDGDAEFVRFTPSSDNYYVIVYTGGIYTVQGECCHNNGIPVEEAQILTYHGVPFDSHYTIYGGTYYWGDGWFCVVDPDDVYGFDVATETTTDYIYAQASTYANIGSTMTDAISGSYYSWVNCFSYKNGTTGTYLATNKTLTKGCWYEVKDGVIQAATPIDDIRNWINQANPWFWTETNVKTENFVAGPFTGMKADAVKASLKKTVAELATINEEVNLVATPSVFVVDQKKMTITAISDTTFTADKAFKDCNVVYNNNTAKTIVYIFGDDPNPPAPTYAPVITHIGNGYYQISEAAGTPTPNTGIFYSFLDQNGNKIVTGTPGTDYNIAATTGLIKLPAYASGIKAGISFDNWDTKVETTMMVNAD